MGVGEGVGAGKQVRLIPGCIQRTHQPQELHCTQAHARETTNTNNTKQHHTRTGVASSGKRGATAAGVRLEDNGIPSLMTPLLSVSMVRNTARKCSKNSSWLCSWKSSRTFKNSEYSTMPTPSADDALELSLQRQTPSTPTPSHTSTASLTLTGRATTGTAGRIRNAHTSHGHNTATSAQAPRQTPGSKAGETRHTTARCIANRTAAR